MHSLASRDEQNYLKAVAEKEDNARRRDDIDAQKMNRIRSNNMQGLHQQMQEREVQRKILEFQEKKFAEDVKNKVINEQQAEDAKREEAKRRMREYNNALNGQIKEAQMKRKYDRSLMTEHERKIHDKDIKAYMEMDNQNMFNRGIPGLAGGHEQ